MNEKTIYTILLGFLSILFIWWLFSDSNRKEITNYPPTGRNIIAFGASITSGYGAETTGGFVKLMENKLKRELGYRIINKGTPGDTTADGLIRLERDVLNLNPKVVILSLGGNDFLKKVPIEETEANLNIIIEKIHQQGSVVILLGIRGGIFKDDATIMFKRIAKKYKTAYVPDILNGLIFKKPFMSDAIHPNDKGHKVIAQKVYPILEKVLSK